MDCALNDFQAIEVFVKNLHNL